MGKKQQHGNGSGTVYSRKKTEKRRVLHRKRYVPRIGNLVLGVEVARFHTRLCLRTRLLRRRAATG